MVIFGWREKSSVPICFIIIIDEEYSLTQPALPKPPVWIFGVFKELLIPGKPIS